MEDLIIIGGGGVGKEVALLVEQINDTSPTWTILGFVDDNTQLYNTTINGYKVLGGISYLERMNDTYIICAIANYEVKKKVIDKINNKKIKYANIIHPSVYISKTNNIGKDVIIYPGVIMSTNISIGNHVIISPKCGIGHEAVIEDYCSLLWNVNISGNVRIGKGVLVGSGSTIIQSKCIGRGSIIGAGAIVVNNLPKDCTAVGIPAKPIKFHRV
jgi:sugar O-acyltransferase (sialic acid O-acetyltransferase NeuD family)